MNKVNALICLCLTAFILTSCGKQPESIVNFVYMPIQRTQGENWSIIDHNAKVIVQEEYPAEASLSKITDGVFWLFQEGKYQLFSLENPKMPVIDEVFTGVTAFQSGVSAVAQPNQPLRIIDTKGVTVDTLPANVKKCFQFSQNGYAEFVDTDDNVGLLDSHGTVTIPAADQVILGMESEGLVLVKKNNENTVMILDTKGQKQGEINADLYEVRTVVSDKKIIARYVDNPESPLVVLNTKGEKMFDIKHSLAINCDHIGYIDGYLVYCNEDGKFGVANDKGETIIRPKYEGLFNLGNGLFQAKKRDLIGIVNAEDDPVVGFNYTGFVCCMDPNFLMFDNGEFVLIDRGGKRLATFENFSVQACDTYVEYIDVEGLTAKMAEKILDLATPKTAAQIFGNTDFNPDDYHFSSALHLPVDIDDKLECIVNVYFNGGVSEEKTHTEEVNDGWFTTTETISDGWFWSDSMQSGVNGTIRLLNVPAKTEAISKAIGIKLLEASYNFDGEEYIKSTRLGDNTYETRISLSPDTEKIHFTININTGE